VVIWTFWAIIIPLATKNYWLFFLSGPIILALGWFGLVSPSSVIRANWRTIQKIIKTPYPLFNLTNIRFSLPPGGGLSIDFEGLRPHTFQIDGPPKAQSMLHLAGDPFWQCLPRFMPAQVRLLSLDHFVSLPFELTLLGSTQAVVAFKNFFHPITLFPNYTTPQRFTSSVGGRFKWNVAVPSQMKVLGKEFKVSTKTIEGYAHSMLAPYSPMLNHHRFTELLQK